MKTQFQLLFWWTGTLSPGLLAEQNNKNKDNSDSSLFKQNIVFVRIECLKLVLWYDTSVQVKEHFYCVLVYGLKKMLIPQKWLFSIEWSCKLYLLGLQEDFWEHHACAVFCGPKHTAIHVKSCIPFVFQFKHQKSTVGPYWIYMYMYMASVSGCCALTVKTICSGP